jgi:antagonist of KipI
MDREALRLANLIVGNDEGAACIEITAGGFRAEFLNPCRFAVTGADQSPVLDGRAVSNWRLLEAEGGAVLTLGYARSGFRAYLALAGGVGAPVVMGSRSTYLRGGFGGYGGRALKRGDVLHSGRALGTPVARIPDRLIPPYGVRDVLRAVPGPQDDRIAPEDLAVFFRSRFEISERSDRMGCVLRGPAIGLRYGADIVSDGTFPGMVQVPGNGEPVILGVDSQTAGGYVKIATVIASDLPLLAQLAPGSEVGFEKIGLLEAREIYLKREFFYRRFLEESGRNAARRGDRRGGEDPGA